MSDTCSAVPADLKAYAAAGLHMDCLLRAQAGRLQDAIDRLRASHPDSSVLGRVLPVGSNLTHYATRNASTDVWVGDVGEAFQHANGNANPHQVQTASSRTINATLKLEEPHGPPGAEVLARLDPKARGSIFTNWHSAADWLRQNKGWLAMHWAFFAMGGDLPLILSPLTGFRITFAGGWAELHGPRVGYQASLLKRYMQSANLDRWSMLKGKPEIAKFYRPVTAIRGGLSAAFNPRDAEFLKAMPRGGGGLAALLTVGGDVYDYTAGAQKSKGLASNDFAASTAVDLGITAGGIAAGAAASAGTGALLGAEVGSVVPGAGTAIGLAVGAGIGAFLATDTGKSLRNGAVHGVSTGLKAAEDGIGSATKSVGNFFGL